MTQATCEERIENEWAKEKERLANFRQHHPQSLPDTGEVFSEYHLDFGFVPEDTYNDQTEAYWRYQICWGGPSSDIRYYIDEEAKDGLRIEYWFMDWFDGANIRLTEDDRELAMWVFFEQGK